MSKISGGNSVVIGFDSNGNLHTFSSARHKECLEICERNHWESDVEGEPVSMHLIDAAPYLRT